MLTVVMLNVIMLNIEVLINLFINFTKWTACKSTDIYRTIDNWTVDTCGQFNKDILNKILGSLIFDDFCNSVRVS